MLKKHAESGLNLQCTEIPALSKHSKTLEKFYIFPSSPNGKAEIDGFWYM